jgi:hypothetical protein
MEAGYRWQNLCHSLHIVASCSTFHLVSIIHIQEQDTQQNTQKIIDVMSL